MMVMMLYEIENICAKVYMYMCVSKKANDKGEKEEKYL